MLSLRKIEKHPADGFKLGFRFFLVILILVFLQWFMAYVNVPIYARIDLFLYLVVCSAPLMKPINHLFFAIAIGYFLDVLSGRLWGFHIATYVFAVAFIRITSDKADMMSIPFQVILVGLCSILQGCFVIFYILSSYEIFNDFTEHIISIFVIKTTITVMGAIFFSNFFFRWFIDD